MMRPSTAPGTRRRVELPTDRGPRGEAGDVVVVLGITSGLIV